MEIGDKIDNYQITEVLSGGMSEVYRVFDGTTRYVLKRLKEDYPDLLQDAYDVEAPNKEDYVMLKLGACKVFRSGNTKWEKRY